MVFRHFLAKDHSLPHNDPMEKTQRAVLRVDHYSKQERVTGSAKHNVRDYTKEDRIPANIITTESHKNAVLHGPNKTSEINAEVDRLIAKAERKRPGHVRVIEYVIGGSTQTMRNMADSGKDTEYYQATLEWIKKKHGAENVVSACVHRDEVASPSHMHVLVVPLHMKEQGKFKGLWLTAEHFIGGRSKLSALQTDFAKSVSQRFGLERGLEGSKEPHKDYKQWHKEQAAGWEALQAEIPEITVPPPPRKVDSETWAKEQTDSINEKIKKAFTTLNSKIMGLLEQVDDQTREVNAQRAELVQGRRCKAYLRHLEDSLAVGKPLDPQRIANNIQIALYGPPSKKQEQTQTQEQVVER